LKSYEEKEGVSIQEPGKNKSTKMISLEAQKELRRIIIREKDSLVLGKLQEDHLSSEKLSESVKNDGSAIKPEEISKLLTNIHKEKSPKYSMSNIASLLEADEEKLTTLFRKVLKEKQADKDTFLSKIKQLSDIPEKEIMSILRLLKSDGEHSHKEPISFFKIAERLKIKENLLLMYLKKTLIEADLKIKKSRFIFMPSFLKDNTKIEALFLMVAFAKTNKYHFDPKHEYLFVARNKDIYTTIRLELIKSTENIKFYEEDVVNHLEKTFKIDNGESFLSILTKEKVLVKAFDYYILHPKSTNYKYEVIEYLIARNFSKEFNINKNWDKIYREMKMFFPEMTKVKPGQGGDKYATKDQLKATATSLLSISKTLILCDKSTLIFKQDLIREIDKVRPYVKDIENKVKEIGAYSLQNFWEEKADELKKKGIKTLHKFYSLLTLYESDIIYCKRYPSVVNEEISKRLKKENLKDIFNEKRDLNLSHKENQKKLGINTVSYRQFFLI